MGEAALRYAQRKIPVFPVRGKLPLTEHGFKDATFRAETVRRWWATNPEANIAIPTGAVSGLVVLDVDPRHRGNESLAELEAKHGSLPQTLESKTGGGGRHLFFALTEGQIVRNSAGKLGPGLDVRGQGGYVVAPPSIHPVTGQPYRWANRLKPAPVPAWLLRMLSAPEGSSVSTVDAENAIPTGQRNDALARIAGAMRRKGCTQETLEAALLAENSKRCVPPLSEAEVRQIAASIGRYTPEPITEAAGPRRPEKRKPFPEVAWRGIFFEYRDAMKDATEASDTFHFATLWTRCAVALGRRVWLSYGMKLFPNVYLVCFGPTGDRKTTATRKAAEIGKEFKTVRGGGSGEGLADEFSGATPGEGFLLYAEEFSQILRPGRWDGATLIPFLTQCFDCPPRYEMKYRKSPVKLDEPTPSLLAGSTPDWFWQDFRAKDFAGGFGNRLFFLAGERKPPIPLPTSPDLGAISRSVDALASVPGCEVRFEPKARALWDDFYRAWVKEERRRDPLLLAAVQRIPAYVLKLAMLYAATEGTLPTVTYDQLAAAVLVGRYGETCAGELLSLQNAGTNPRKELERHIVSFVRGEPGRTTTRHAVYKALWRHYSDAEMFDRAFRSLKRAGEIYTEHRPRRMVLVSTEPLD